MLEKGEICWPSTFCSYFLVAIAQMLLILVAVAHHAKIKEATTFVYIRYMETSVCIGLIAVVLVVVQLYISMVVTSIEGPPMIIYWLCCAQLMVTLYFFYLPFEYSNEISRDEWFMVDDYFTDEEDAIFPARMESVFWEGDLGFEDYGTIVPQLSGPGGVSSVSVYKAQEI